MAITRYEEAKNQRYFYVENYRRLLGWVTVSIGLNILIVLIMAYIFFEQPPSAYYSTNGRTSPVKLTPMATPNMSATPLLLDKENQITGTT